MDYWSRFSSLGHSSNASGKETPGVRQAWATIRPLGFVFVATVLSIFTLLCMLLFSVFLCYFKIAVPMRKCSEEHACMSSTFPLAILNGTCFFRPVKAMKIGNDALSTAVSRSYSTSSKLCRNLKLFRVTPLRLLYSEYSYLLEAARNTGKGGWFFIFRLFKSILIFVNWISLYFFHIL